MKRRTFLKGLATALGLSAITKRLSYDGPIINDEEVFRCHPYCLPKGFSSWDEYKIREEIYVESIKGKDGWLL